MNIFNVVTCTIAGITFAVFLTFAPVGVSVLVHSESFSPQEIAKRSKTMINLAVATAFVVPWMAAVLLLLLRLQKVCQDVFLAWKNDLFAWKNNLF